MKAEPCSICGGTDMNLIDGFYYCVECGTQDVNAQETVVEHTVLADGTFAHAASRKVTTILKDAIEMSGEWHKWHTFNFIIAGLVEELMELGASEGFKNQVLWIWTRYMKKFQNKDQMGKVSEPEEKELFNYSRLEFEDESNDASILGDHDSEDKEETKQQQALIKKLKVVTKGLLLGILYIALNLDRSEIQLSHLCRFVKEGRLSIVNCRKFVPKELNLKSIPHWLNFLNCIALDYKPPSVRQMSLTLIKTLDLGVPLVPDLRKLVDNYVTELCLPMEFKNVVFSLMAEVSPEFLEVTSKYLRRAVNRVPDFEGFAMAYVLIALKMCFGLDDQYEKQLSEAVDKINEEECRLKSHKLGLYSNATDRLFSFREWCNFLQFRKTILSKYYLPIAQQLNLDTDDHVIVEQSTEKRKWPVQLSDEVTMDILNKIGPKNEGNVIPKAEFLASLTPMSSYTDVILQYFQEPDLKLLLSEDFSQYSLKYACEDLMLPETEIMCQGVTTENKIIEPVIIGTLISKQTDTSMVFVRNCENRNWLKTNPPTIDHITKIAEDVTCSDRDSDRGYDSNTENVPVDEIIKITSENTITDIKLETIEEEVEDKSIFDDPFDDVDEEDKNSVNDEEQEINSFLFHNATGRINSENSFPEGFAVSPVTFNPMTFDRERTIKELILFECKQYRIPIPKEYDTREPRKRKSNIVHYGAGESEDKRIKLNNKSKPGEAKIEIDKIIAEYFHNVQKNLFNEVSDHLQSVIKDFNEDVNLNNDDHSGIGSQDRNSSAVIENLDKNVEPSILDDNDSVTNLDDLLPKLDSKFDEKTYDINQLYIKYRDAFLFEDLDISDTQVNNILDEKIEQLRNGVTCGDHKEENEPKKPITSESEDEEEVSNDRKAINKDTFEPLIANQQKIKKFKYWLRHYSSATMKKTYDLKYKFDLELRENCPKSFNFVINECAAILDCSAFSLYKDMQTIEKMLLCRVK